MQRKNSIAASQKTTEAIKKFKKSSTFVLAEIHLEEKKNIIATVKWVLEQNL